MIIDCIVVNIIIPRSIYLGSKVQRKSLTSVKISPALDLKEALKSAISLRNSRGRRLVLASLSVYDTYGG
jgi:hypothetical protein